MFVKQCCTQIKFPLHKKDFKSSESTLIDELKAKEAIIFFKAMEGLMVEGGALSLALS